MNEPEYYRLGCFNKEIRGKVYSEAFPVEITYDCTDPGNYRIIDTEFITKKKTYKQF